MELRGWWIETTIVRPRWRESDPRSCITLSAWKASKPKKDRSRATTDKYVPAEGQLDYSREAITERSKAHQAKQAAQAEKIVLSSSDSPKEKVKRIKAVEGALTVWPAERDRQIDELEKEKRELEKESHLARCVSRARARALTVFMRSNLILA